MNSILRVIMMLFIFNNLFQPLLSFAANAKDEVQIHLDRAWSLFASQKYEEALKECDEAIKFDPNNPKAYYCKALYL